jgi:4-hydroxy-tetrahydrodipicolinate synthase
MASAHLRTERFAALMAAANAGRLDEARAHAEALLPLVRALFAEPSPAVLKAMLHDAGRIATPDVRMPLAGASAGAVARALSGTTGPVHGQAPRKGGSVARGCARAQARHELRRIGVGFRG